MSSLHERHFGKMLPIQLKTKFLSTYEQLQFRLNSNMNKVDLLLGNVKNSS